MALSLHNLAWMAYPGLLLVAESDVHALVHGSEILEQQTSGTLDIANRDSVDGRALPVRRSDLREALRFSLASFVW